MSLVAIMREQEDERLARKLASTYQRYATKQYIEGALQQQQPY